MNRTALEQQQCHENHLTRSGRPFTQPPTLQRSSRAHEDMELATDQLQFLAAELQALRAIPDGGGACLARVDSLRRTIEVIFDDWFFEHGEDEPHPQQANLIRLSTLAFDEGHKLATKMVAEYERCQAYSGAGPEEPAEQAADRSVDIANPTSLSTPAVPATNPHGNMGTTGHANNALATTSHQASDASDAPAEDAQEQ